MVIVDQRKEYVGSIQTITEKVIAPVSTMTGFTSILGSWQICHNLCLAIIAVLSIIGITVTGFPLLFLTRIAVPLWSIAALLFIFTFVMYLVKRCVSPKLLLFNAGLIIAGIPFEILQPIAVVFWLIGGLLVVLSIVLFACARAKRIKSVDKSQKKRRHTHDCCQK